MFLPKESPWGPQEWLLEAVKTLQMCESLRKAQVRKGSDSPTPAKQREHGHLLLNSALSARIVTAD